MAISDLTMAKAPAEARSFSKPQIQRLRGPGICGKNTPFIHPENSMHMFWQSTGLFFILYELFITPYRLCFNEPAKGMIFYFEIGLGTYYIVDVLLKSMLALTFSSTVLQSRQTCQHSNSRQLVLGCIKTKCSK